MDWDKKTEMCKLGNIMNLGESDKTEFQNFCLKHVSEFDNQAWDMFCNIVDVIPDEIEENVEFWKKIWEHLKCVDCNNKSFGFRSGFRIAIMQTICEDKFKLS